MSGAKETLVRYGPIFSSLGKIYEERKPSLDSESPKGAGNDRRRPGQQQTMGNIARYR